ncbi:unnamed protein product [Calypogeia fissa]
MRSGWWGRLVSYRLGKGRRQGLGHKPQGWVRRWPEWWWWGGVGLIGGGVKGGVLTQWRVGRLTLLPPQPKNAAQWGAASCGVGYGLACGPWAGSWSRLGGDLQHERGWQG